MSQFVVAEDGGVYEASVRDTVNKLKELFPEIDPTSLEANLMLERSHRLLADQRESHWARYGLTGRRFILLRLLYTSHRKHLSMSEIATEMHLGMNNVTQLVTYQSEWNDFLGSRPDLYEAGPKFGDKTVYTVRRAPSMFLKGAGTTAADFNTIRVTLADPQGQAVVKYAWTEGLKADPPAEAFPFAAESDVTLVGIKPNGASSVTVRY